MASEKSKAIQEERFRTNLIRGITKTQEDAAELKKMIRALTAKVNALAKKGGVK